MIRFHDGAPDSVWYSQHEYGEAFTYEAVQKVGKRPIAFSAKGSHANYAKAGKHDLHKISQYSSSCNIILRSNNYPDQEIPENLVFDVTSQGRLWDPTLSAYYYTYSSETEDITPAIEGTPVHYLHFSGKWGDKEYTDDVPEQSSFQDYHKWTSGPQGPLFKHWDRPAVCWPREEAKGGCHIQTSL
jgi:hypothetical protein